ncbi:MAG TPA: DUF1707 domain-containing protein [Acidimicrobiales bacterium]|nr:DUF1707 domain-containing protein [Acidimicrobiales bacterium]
MQDVPDKRPDASSPASSAGSGLRASDADRTRFATMLERHFVDGRLSEEEFSDRMDRVLAARTLVELYALSSDLPEFPAVDVPHRPPGQKRHAWRFWRS